MRWILLTNWFFFWNIYFRWTEAIKYFLSNLINCNNFIQKKKTSSGVAICLLGFFTSALIGRLGDVKSRKAALLIPICGLILEGISLVVQSYYMQVSDGNSRIYLFFLLINFSSFLFIHFPNNKEKVLNSKFQFFFSII